jgi:hypothetical protein
MKWLSQDSVARGRLSDPDRAGTLLTDLKASSLGVRPEKSGVRSQSVEIHMAVRKAGLRHQLGGRPLPQDQLPSRDDAMEAVRAAIRVNRFAVAKHHSDQEIGEVVDADYLEIEPWPFWALTE